AGVLGIAQATGAIATKGELPFETNIEFARKQHEGVDQIRAQHSDSVALLADEPETMGKLQRQQQRRSPALVALTCTAPRSNTICERCTGTSCSVVAAESTNASDSSRAGFSRIRCNNSDGLVCVDSFSGEKPAIFGCASSWRKSSIPSLSATVRVTLARPDGNLRSVIAKRTPMARKTSILASRGSAKLRS